MIELSIRFDGRHAGVSFLKSDYASAAGDIRALFAADVSLYIAMQIEFAFNGSCHVLSEYGVGGAAEAHVISIGG